MPERLSPVEAVRRFRRLRVLVIGDVMLDTYLEGEASRLCREGPVPVVSKTGEEQVAGGAANAAANLRALDAEVAIIGAVGPDEAGAALRRILTDTGVDCNGLIEDPAVSTLHKLRILANNQYVVRFDAGDTGRLSAAGRRRAGEYLADALPQCDLIVISDYGYGVASDGLIARLAALRAGRPVPLVVDAKDLRRFRGAGATLVTPNHAEAAATVEPGRIWSGPPRIPEIEHIGRRLLRLIDAEHAAITLAADGVLLLDRTRSLHLPAHPVARVSDVGAGDSFTAAAALALAVGARPEDAVRIGIAAGGLAVARRRTAVVALQELLQCVGRQDAPHSLPLADLSAHLDRERQRGRTIVFTNGVFDLLHAGHVRLLREARRLGDVLVVGVNSDESARRLKGPNRPICRLEERLALVAALEGVDHVIPFDDDTPEALIRTLRPHFHVKGGDYTAEDLPETAAVRGAGGEVVILPLAEQVSTSAVIDRVVSYAMGT